MAGLVALAVAMGIGRFAFTPIMPMMEADAGLTLRAGSWLASVNYLGYFLGALCAAWLSMRWAVRGGLVLIAIVTFAMGMTDVFAWQLILRLLAGMASAWVLVHVSAWALGWLQAQGRSAANGVVYAGVGVGIAASGLVCMGIMHVGGGSGLAWQLFGGLALLAALASWRAFGQGAPATPGKHRNPERMRWTSDKRLLVVCYGAFGVGYIIPATYLPDMAHGFISNPLVFGLAWPVFGTASAICTWLAARWMTRVNGRKLWALCYAVMAAGVVLPALWTSLTAIMLAALLVGGTFMIATMLGLREARLVAGDGATPLMAVMTASFALGQIIGPLLVSAIAAWPHGFAIALIVAAVALVWGGWALWRSVGSGGHDAGYPQASPFREAGSADAGAKHGVR